MNTPNPTIDQPVASETVKTTTGGFATIRPHVEVTGPLGGGIRSHQFIDGRAEGEGDRAQHGEAGLALAVLHHRHLRRSTVDRRGEGVEGHTPGGAQLPDASPQRERVKLGLIDTESGEGGEGVCGDHAHSVPRIESFYNQKNAVSSVHPVGFARPERVTVGTQANHHLL